MAWFGYFYGSQQQEDENPSDIPEAPAVPEDQKKKSMIAMNCIRQYIISRNKNLRRLNVIVEEKIRQQLRDTTTMFGKSDLVCYLESIVASSELSDDLGNLTDKEWRSLVDYIIKAYDVLDIKYKKNHHTLTMGVSDPYNATDEEGTDPLLIELRKNIREHDLKRSEDISAYTKDLYEYVISNVYDVARRHGSSQYLAELNNIHQKINAATRQYEYRRSARCQIGLGRMNGLRQFHRIKCHTRPCASSGASHIHC